MHQNKIKLPNKLGLGNSLRVINQDEELWSTCWRIVLKEDTNR